MGRTTRTPNALRPRLNLSPLHLIADDALHISIFINGNCTIPPTNQHHLYTFSFDSTILFSRPCRLAMMLSPNSLSFPSSLFTLFFSQSRNPHLLTSITIHACLHRNLHFFSINSAFSSLPPPSRNSLCPICLYPYSRYHLFSFSLFQFLFLSSVPIPFPT